MQMTDHAQVRCAQRQIDPETFAFIKKYGRKIWRTGVAFYFLGKRDIPQKLRGDDRFAKLEGVILLVSADGTLITTYRNPNGLKTIRKKTKYRMQGASYKICEGNSVWN